MRAVVPCIALAWLAGITLGGAPSHRFTFAGFHRSMDLAALLDRYPASSHEVIPGAGVRRQTAQDDPKGWIREFFRTRAASGTYVLRLTPGESRDHVYYVQAEVREGTTERLWLLLEAPPDVVKPGRSPNGNETRYPACDALAKPLTIAYGKPEALAPRWEEALELFDYVWTDPPEAMTLQCGRYQGRKTVFAIGVTLEKTASR
jgi:hypothetical protein